MNKSYQTVLSWNVFQNSCSCYSEYFPVKLDVVQAAYGYAVMSSPDMYIQTACDYAVVSCLDMYKLHMIMQLFPV